MDPQLPIRSRPPPHPAGRRSPHLRAAVSCSQRPGGSRSLAGGGPRVARREPAAAVDHAPGRALVGWPPLLGADVAFTFDLLRRHPALDRRGVWAFLEDVRAWMTRRRTSTFQRVFVPGFGEVAAQPIVPRHVCRTWRIRSRSQREPGGYGPVHRGPPLPETRCTNWGRNRATAEGAAVDRCPPLPRLPGERPREPRARVRRGGLGRELHPAIDRVYVARNPESHRYWFPLTGSTVFLYANTTRAPSTTGGYARPSAWPSIESCSWTSPFTATRAPPTPPA